MTSHKRAPSFGRQAFFPGAHLLSAVSYYLYICKLVTNNVFMAMCNWKIKKISWCKIDRIKIPCNWFDLRPIIDLFFNYFRCMNSFRSNRPYLLDTEQVTPNILSCLIVRSLTGIWGEFLSFAHQVSFAFYITLHTSFVMSHKHDRQQ